MTLTIRTPQLSAYLLTLLCIGNVAVAQTIPGFTVTEDGSEGHTKGELVTFPDGQEREWTEASAREYVEQEAVDELDVPALDRKCERKCGRRGFRSFITFHHFSYSINGWGDIDAEIEATYTCKCN